jgi:CheY-like chemotaxis protein
MSGSNLMPNPSVLELETRVPYSQTQDSRGAICVLSADGSAINQAVVSLLLGYDQRFKCLQAFSGQEVLQMVDTLPYLPDVILLDVSLPDMPGAEVSRDASEEKRLSGSHCILT